MSDSTTAAQTRRDEPPEHGDHADEQGNLDLEKQQSRLAFDRAQQARLLGRYLSQPLDTTHLDLPLLACCFATGLIDAASFRNWGMFIGMQTGNTVILGLSTAGLPENPHAWLTTLVSLAAFLVGAWATFRGTAWLCGRESAEGGTAKGVASSRCGTSFLFVAQALILIVCAALASVPGLIPQNPAPSGPGDRDPASVIDDVRIVSLIPALAVQGGMQIATSRLLGLNELPINVLTSTYTDLMGDVRLWATNNVKRDRRVAAVVLLLAGAIVSGWLLRSSGGLMSVLWVAAAVKLLAGLGVFAFMPAAPS